MKAFKSIILAALISFVAAACQKEIDIAVTGITVNPKSINLLVGTECPSLSVAVSPSNATNKTVLWVSSDNNIASVDMNSGVVSAVNPGIATILVKSDDGGFSDTCVVNVVSEMVNVSGISLKDADGAALDNVILSKGDSLRVIAVIEPDNATEQTVRWKSSNDSIMTVTDDGVIAAVNPGNAVLVASSVDGAFTATCHVNVICPAARIVLDTNSIVLNEFEIFWLRPSVEPKEYDAELVWSSSDTTVVRVFNGMLSAGRMNAAGDESMAVVTVCSKYDPAVNAQCTVYVACKVSGVRFEFPEMYVKENDSIQSQVIVYPKRASDRKISFSSKNPYIAEVDSSGLIKGLRPGDAEIVAKTDDGGHKASVKVHVFSRVDGIRLEPAEIELDREGDKDGKLLEATVTPDRASIPNIRWTSSDEKVVTVDERGLIKPVSVGLANVIASSVDGGLVSSCTVNVISKLKNIAFKKAPATGIEIIEGSSLVLEMQYDPADATDRELYWNSSDTTVLRVIDGTLISIKEGTALITATAVADNTVKASCTVNVISKSKPIKSFSLRAENDRTSIFEGEKINLIPFDIWPPDADSQEFEWFSSAPEVASVSQSGMVTGQQATKGSKVTITAMVKNHSEVQASYTLDVYSHVKTVDFEPDILNLTTFNGGASASKTVVKVSPDWAVNTEIDTIYPEEPGLITLVKGDLPGEYKVISIVEKGNHETRIVAISKDNAVKGYCTVKISEKIEPEAVKVNEIILSEDKITLKEGEEKTITSTVKPENASNPVLYWSSADGTYASVNQQGTIEGRKEGKTTIFVEATDGSGVKRAIDVTVEKSQHTIQVESVTLNIEDKKIEVGDSFTLSATISPSNAENKNVKWKITKGDGVVGINPIGLECGVTALQDGNAEITVTTDDGGFSASCAVAVQEVVHVKDIELDITRKEIGVNESFVLTATVKPDNATNNDVELNLSTGFVDKVRVEIISKTDNVAKVCVTGLAEVSNARVNVRSLEDPAIMGTCFVTVIKIPVSGISLNKEIIVLKEGMTTSMLKATVYPETATNKNVEWSISDSKVATIDPKSGTITALKKGTAMITATTEDGGKTATCELTVNSSQVDGGATEWIQFNDLNNL